MASKWAVVWPCYKLRIRKQSIVRAAHKNKTVWIPQRTSVKALSAAANESGYLPLEREKRTGQPGV